MYFDIKDFPIHTQKEFRSKCILRLKPTSQFQRTDKSERNVIIDDLSGEISLNCSLLYYKPSGIFFLEVETSYIYPGLNNRNSLLYYCFNDDNTFMDIQNEFAQERFYFNLCDLFMNSNELFLFGYLNRYIGNEPRETFNFMIKIASNSDLIKMLKLYSKKHNLHVFDEEDSNFKYKLKFSEYRRDNGYVLPGLNFTNYVSSSSFIENTVDSENTILVYSGIKTKEIEKCVTLAYFSTDQLGREDKIALEFTFINENSFENKVIEFDFFIQEFEDYFILNQNNLTISGRISKCLVFDGNIFIYLKVFISYSESEYLFTDEFEFVLKFPCYHDRLTEILLGRLRLYKVDIWNSEKK